MKNRECCRSCAHCTSVKSSNQLWCELRKIKVHSDIAAFVFCHHWVKSSPILPILDGKKIQSDKQLSFGRVFFSKN